MYSPTKKSVTLRIFAALIGLTVTASLAACSNNDEDDNNPELGKTTDASVSESTEFVPASEDGPAQNVPEPRLPAVTTEDTVEGAEAALRYFWEAETYASLTGDSDPMLVISSDECNFCEESIEGWPRNYEDGSWSAIHGDLEITVIESEKGFDDESGETVAHVYFELTEPPTDFYDSSGNRMDGSFDSPDTTEWFALLIFDGTAQTWKVDWVGLEDTVRRDSQ